MEAEAQNKIDPIISDTVIRQVRERFSVGPALAEAYLRYWSISRNRNVSSLEEILSLPQPEPMWFEYALTTNWRGQELRKSLQPFLRPWFSRYLDVGCGFGGCMQAFAKLGMEVLGIDVDPERVSLARANLADHCIAPNAFHASILDADIKERLGRVDLVTCIDVIEHVLDVPKTLETIVSMLNAGGVLVLEIPNKNFIPFVSADGHFQLFGITQLPRPQAIEYQGLFFDFEYDVGDYYEKSHYISILEKLGCKAESVPSHLHSPLAFERARPLIEELAGAQVSFSEGKAKEMPLSLCNAVQHSYNTFLEKVSDDYEQASRDASLRRDFLDYYLLDFWTLTARKIS